MDEPTVVTEPSPQDAGEDVVAAVPPPPSRQARPSPRSRQARVVIRKVGPWSVFKFSLVFYLCVMAVILLAMAILYAILGSVGVLEHVTELGKNLGIEGFKIHGGWIFARLTVVGLAMVVIWSLINVFIVFLYNLIADVVGGIEITLSERH